MTLKRTLLLLVLTLWLSGCGRLDTLLYSPPQTAETWLAIQPWIELRIASHTIILVQPTTSAIVYLLGLITIGAGLYILRLRQGQRSRLWWGIALLLWGLGALLAGTSYEAFSYQIKCAGRAACVWTSGWEIWYLLLSVASVNAMMVAQAYSCTAGKWRKIWMRYAFLNMSLYSLAVLIGTIIPIKFLISFELLILVAAPNIAIFLMQNGWRYYHHKQKLDLVLLIGWGWLVLTILAYFLYLISGWTQTLWSQGIWFSENDVLHLGLIVWMLYLALVATPIIEDQKAIDFCK